MTIISRVATRFLNNPLVHFYGFGIPTYSYIKWKKLQ